MEEEFWQERWREKQIGFHAAEPHKCLKAHFSAMKLGRGDTVFVPLCGKTLDIDWLLDKRLSVVGVEFNREAVEELFERLKFAPKVTECGALVRFEAGGLRIYVGDIFALDAGELGPVQGIYDRAALVALPQDMRRGYAGHLAQITGNASQLLVSYDYDQDQMEGPPFSVPASAIERLYSKNYTVELLSSAPIDGPLQARCEGTENAYLLAPK